MIELFKALSWRLQWLRWPALLICLGFAALFVYAALANDAPDSFFRSGLAGTAWGLLVFVFVTLFPNAPAAATPEHSRWQRLLIGVRRAYYLLLAFGVLIATVAVMALTYRML